MRRSLTDVVKSTFSRASAPAFSPFATRTFSHAKALGIMADLPDECEILQKNEVREEAIKNIDTAKKEEPKKDDASETKKLPKLSAAEFRAYNSMAEHMEYFHNHFRQTWTTLHTACQNGRRPPNTSLKQFLSMASQFTSHLSTHHAIEEQHIFPVLARKMPQFRNTAHLLEQHKKIHEGMDVFEKYIDEVRSGERELELKELAKKMEWGDVLWAHLADEVKTLGAENMRQYWTVDEMRRMPM